MKIIQMLLFLLIPLLLRAQEDWTKRLDKTTLYDLMKDAEQYNWIEIKEVKDYYTKIKGDFLKCKLNTVELAKEEVLSITFKQRYVTPYRYKCELYYNEKQHFIWEVGIYVVNAFSRGTPDHIFWFNAKDGSICSEWSSKDAPKFLADRVQNKSSSDKPKMDAK